MPILMPKSSIVHYKCAFDIVEDKYPIKRLQSKIREWLSRHFLVRSEAFKLNQLWFEVGDTDQEKVGSSFFRVAVNKGNYSSQYPEHWVLEFIHYDSGHTSRMWCTEIGLSRIDDQSVRFTCVSRHAVREGWVGDLPPEPGFSVPNIVKIIVKEFNCKKNGHGLTWNIQQCLVGNVRFFVERINDRSRIHPFVVTVPDVDGSEYLDLNELQKIVLANANTYYLPYSNLDEFNALMPQGLGLNPGMARVYTSGAYASQFSSRHRFYTKYKIEEIGSYEVLRQLGIALARNSRTFKTNDVIRIKDVIYKRSLHKLAELRSAGSAHDSQEYCALLEEENANLISAISDKEQEIAGYLEMNEEIEVSLNKERAQRYALESILSRNSCRVDSFCHISELPTSLDEVLNISSKIFADTLVVHTNAYDTARNFAACYDVPCIRSAWRILYHMATSLHELVFSSQVYDIEKEFLARTGIDIGMTECKSTKRDRKLMRLRSCEYNGEIVDFTPHVKGKKSDAYLRVHFAPLNAEKKLLICHCGEHIATYGTQRL